ncbi:MAG: hypothetical protein OXT09_08115 [Myxococcales bacterium]|nr:hypothetical protein [Myxococcales bacterium]
MPISYTIDLQRQLTRTRAWGVVTDDDLRAHVNALQADANNRVELDAIFDGSLIERLQVSAEGVRAAAQHLRPEPGIASGRMAMIAPPSKTAFGMGRMYELLRADLEIGIFQSVAEAEAWLGLTEA